HYIVDNLHLINNYNLLLQQMVKPSFITIVTLLCYLISLSSNICLLHIFSVFDIVISVSFFFFSSRRRHTRSLRDWSSDVCSSDLCPASPRSWISASIAACRSRSTAS